MGIDKSKVLFLRQEQDFEKIKQLVLDARKETGRSLTKDETKQVIMKVIDPDENELNDPERLELVEKYNDLIAKGDSLDSTNFKELRIPYKGNPDKVMGQIKAYCSDRGIELADLKVTGEHIRAKVIPSDYADGIATELEVTQKGKNIGDKKVAWLQSVDGGQIGATPKGVTEEQLKEKTTEYIAEYIKSTVEQNKQKSAHESPSLAGFMAYMEKQQRAINYGDLKNQKGQIEGEIANAVAGNMKENETKFKEQAGDIYKKRVFDILQEKEYNKTASSDYLWALDQLADAHVRVDEKGRMSTKVALVTEPNKLYDLKTIDFRKSIEFKDNIDNEDMKDLVKANKAETGRTNVPLTKAGKKKLKKGEKVAVRTKSLLALTLSQLGIDPKSLDTSETYKLHDKMPQFRAALMMLRNVAGEEIAKQDEENQEQQTEENNIEAGQ
jgi:hypothetical protein